MKKIIKWFLGILATIVGILLLSRKTTDLHEEELAELKEKEDGIKEDLTAQAKTKKELDARFEEWLNKW